MFTLKMKTDAKLHYEYLHLLSSLFLDRKLKNDRVCINQNNLVALSKTLNNAY